MKAEDFLLGLCISVFFVFAPFIAYPITQALSWALHQL